MSFLDQEPWRAILAILLIGFYGVYFYFLITYLIGGVIGEGEWKKGAWKFALSITVAWVSIAALHMIAMFAYEATPFGTAYYSTMIGYQTRCQTYIQDGENSGHYEDDWHSGYAVCRSLSLRWHNLYPRPEWLFGAAPPAP